MASTRNLQGRKRKLGQGENSAPSTAAARTTRASRSSGHDVMISYKQKDSKEQMVKLKKKLEDDRYKVWMDVDAENLAGNQYDGMAKGVTEAKVILMCFSPEYHSSPNCMREANWAADNNKAIIPLKCGRFVKPKEGLGLILAGLTYYDVTTSEKLEENYAAILTAIKQKLGTGRTSATSTAAIPQLRSDGATSVTSTAATPQLPRSDGAEKITQADMTTVVQELDLNQLQDLYEKLGIKKRDVQKAEVNAGATANADLKAKSVLHLWLQRNGRDATRIKILLSLKKSGHEEPMQELQTKWNIYNELLNE